LGSFSAKAGRVGGQGGGQGEMQSVHARFGSADLFLRAWIGVGWVVWAISVPGVLAREYRCARGGAGLRIH
jgi:hypothetical protein